MGYTLEKYCRNIDRSTGVLAIASCYVPFLLAMQYSKHKWLIARPETAWEWIAILHSEASIFIVIVLALLAIRSLWFGYLVLTLLYVISLFDSISWFASGRWFHPEDVVRAIELFQHYGEFVTLERFGWKTLLYAAVPLATGIAILIHKACAGSLEAYAKAATRLRSIIITVASVSVAGYALLTPLAISHNYPHYNTLYGIGNQIYRDQRFSEISPEERNRLFGATPAMAGNAAPRRLNVIMYVLETAPAAYYPDMSEFLKPWVERNGGSLHVMREHYTTYPESDRALFSIMTGNYPCLSRGFEWVASYDYGKPLPKVLGQHGYRTYLLSVAPLAFHDEDVMIRNLGFQTVLESTLAKEAYARAGREKKWLDRSALYQADQEILARSLDIIRAQGDEPFLLAVLPQASHAPFQIPPGYAGNKTDRELLQANARWQWGLMRQILECLEETGQARNTIFIAVGDHGLRHPAESSLSPKQSLLSPVSFKVAFAGCYPKGSVPAMPQAVTSHVDIAPTILEVLGIGYRAEEYHGRSMLSSTSRTVFFLGGEYLPVSGFTWNGWFFMENVNRNLILKSPNFDFDDPAAKAVEIVRDGDERTAIAGKLYKVKGLLTR